jgi:hypothetical protein
MRQSFILLIISIFILGNLSSCKKDELLEDSSVRLRFSTDTLMYDTVFVTLGSVTKNLRVYNDNDQPIKISSIRLASGSNFRINVNGSPGKSFSNIEIRANDSLWIFAEVTVDPNSSLTPYVISDSIVFETNGNIQDVDLVAWGQNAHFFVAKKRSPNLPPYVIIDTLLNSTSTWDDALPYVIYGGFAVVDSSTTLNINEGTQIHFGNNAGLWVYKGGTLNVNGSKLKPVVFQGVRREADFDEEPGQWDRIWINDGGVNKINYAIIKNGFIGLQTETLFEPAMSQNLQITNTIIKNMSGIGIFSRNFFIRGWNNVVANCGLYNTALTIGGDYEFRHCSFVNYWNFGQRSTPAVYIDNYTVDAGNNIIPVDLTKADFLNCIIQGDVDNELVLVMKSGAADNYRFNNCFLKVDNNTPINTPRFTNISIFPDPSFKDIEGNDYQLTAPYEQGDPAYLIPLTPPITEDLNGNIRPSGGSIPDLGAYEFP